MNIYLHADNEIDKPKSFAQNSSMQGYGALWNLEVYREKQLSSTVHWTSTNYNYSYIAIKPLVLSSPKMQDLQERHI